MKAPVPVVPVAAPDQYLTSVFGMSGAVFEVLLLKALEETPADHAASRAARSSVTVMEPRASVELVPGAASGRVELVRRYSNRSDLQERLAIAARRTPDKEPQDRESAGEVTSNDRPPRVWRLRDRLSNDGVQDLIERYRFGVTMRELAAEFKISKSSVKKLLRENGIRRR